MLAKHHLFISVHHCSFFWNSSCLHHFAKVPVTCSSLWRTTTNLCRKRGKSRGRDCRINRATTVAKWAKLTFVKGTALAVACASGYSRLPALTEIQPLASALTGVASCSGYPSLGGPRWRCFLQDRMASRSRGPALGPTRPKAPHHKRKAGTWRSKLGPLAAVRPHQHTGGPDSQPPSVATGLTL